MFKSMNDTLDETCSGPPMRFSTISHGKNIIVTEDGLEAYKSNMYAIYKTGVYIASPLRGACEIELEAIDCGNHRDASLEIGIGRVPKGTYEHFDLPHKIGRTFTNDLCTWNGRSIINSLSGYRIEHPYKPLELAKGDTVGLRLTENGDLSFVVNQRDHGIAATQVFEDSYDVFPVFRLGGSCVGVRIKRTVYEHPAEEHEVQKETLKTIPLPHVNTIRFGFHPVTGKNIILFKDGLHARRVDPDYNCHDAAVYGEQPIYKQGLFEVSITKRHNIEGWSLSIRLGVMRQPAGTNLKHSDVPTRPDYSVNHCVWSGEIVKNWLSTSGDLIRTKYGSVNLDELREGDRVGLQLSTNGDLSFFVNGTNQGVAAKGVLKDGYDIYPVVDVCGRCCAVRITRSEIQSGLLNLQELCIEMIAKCLRSIQEVGFLPLPQKLKKQVEQCIKYLHASD